MSKTLNKKPKNKALIFVTILGLILLITITLYLDSSDSFGFSESLFSGLAFIGLIFTLFMQKEELEMQRNEISENRSVLEKQEEQLRKQRIQMEEANYFS
ncbi:hypothetical protein [Seleniivibrio sp.]|uniref:hypothetical protein n=1 Tax=Seleniivibrio sp. TaxID=2898801 RepID=UPI0025F1956C|nr:hypothetical protein [Seleniivibrio sp.]MCD8552919.1 hypothetical protein [Seleniivibrio sp.]